MRYAWLLGAAVIALVTAATTLHSGEWDSPGTTEVPTGRPWRKGNMLAGTRESVDNQSKATG